MKESAKLRKNYIKKPAAKAAGFSYEMGSLYFITVIFFWAIWPFTLSW